MGNPALAEFQTRLAEQLADALLDRAAAMMVAETNVPGDAQITVPVTFTKDDIVNAVKKVTAGWRAKHNRMLIRDAKGVVLDGSNFESPGQDPITHFVRLEVSTFFDRDETPIEVATQAERLAALLWKPEDGPPPKGVGGLQLLDQDTWWVPKDSRPMHLVDMTGTHQRHLAAFLRRNAAHYKNAEWIEAVSFMTGPLGPGGDMATDAAESELHQLENADPLTWLSEKPLMRALIPTVYLWQVPGRLHGKVTCQAVHECGALLASVSNKRRRVAMAGIVSSPNAQKAFRELFGGIGPAFYRTVELAAGEDLPEATRIAFGEKADE